MDTMTKRAIGTATFLIGTIALLTLVIAVALGI